MKYKIYLTAETSNKWLNCTPSVALENTIVDPVPIEQNAEENLARKLMQYKLKSSFKKKGLKDRDHELQIIKDNPYYSKEMDKSIEELFSAIKLKVDGVESTGEKPLVIFEEKLDTSLWIREGTAQIPIAILTRDTLEIISFDYNSRPEDMEDKFVELELYALAVINEYICLFDMRIILLRYFSLSEQKACEDFFYVDELLEKAEIIFKPKADSAYRGEGEIKPGYYCEGCRARFLCSSKN